jgi:hypothetical protein
LGTIQPYLMDHGIYSRGRFGAWEYEIGNMDHSVMQGVELVNHWLMGEVETTWKDFSQTANTPIPVYANGTNGHADKISMRSQSGHGKVVTGTQPHTLRPENLQKPNGNGHHGE